ncbi:hypothetical protein LCGC14_0793470 [marine sediment metagenome]|uniref:Bacteriophage Mu GpT domain-containing protein n=1 Tax=marine sediment metagenome TaxID=412755 RepID=A0A0F9SYZ8_9ZZZZ
MAVTRLTDVVEPEVFTGYVQLLTAQKSQFIQSGAMESSELLDSFLAGGGETIQVPHWKDLDDTEANVSSDDPASAATALKTTSGREIAQRHSRNQSWSTMDLSQALAGSDPMESIASRVSDYWVRQWNRYLIASVQGLIADNLANDSGDMRNDVALAAGGSPTAVNLFSAEAFLDAAQTMGENSENLVALGVHSVVFTRMQKNNLIDFIPDARGEVNIPVFLGRRVIVDDALPAVANTGNVDYSSFLFGLGAFASGVGSPRVPTAVERIEAQGDGGGQETLHSRVELAIHPRGFAWLGVSQAGKSPTIAEMKAAANWDRRYTTRKQIPIAELVTNG